MENIDIIKEIEKTKKYDIALITTFNFEINFFERFILNKLRGNRINKISLYVDENEFNASIKKEKTNELGRKYMVNTIRCNSAFHPKLMLFLGKNKAKLIIGSGNIKMSGLCKNNEVFNIYEYNKEDESNLYYIQRAVEIFKILNTISINPNFEKELFSEIDKYEYLNKETKKPQDSYLLDNYKKGILEQLKTIIENEEIEEIKIAVPFYDNLARTVKELMCIFKCENVKLYIQNGNSTFPIEDNILPNYVTENIKVFDTFKSNESSNFYHGKVFLLKSKDKSFILYGSSNCTKAALELSFMNGGNFECDILDIGNRDEFEYFFEDMINKNEEKNFTSRKLEYKSDKYEKFRFNYSLMQEDKLIISININTTEEINDIFVNEIKVENYKINNNNLTIIIILNEEFTYNPKYLIKINDEILYGWFVNQKDLNYNRNSILTTFKDDIPEISKFDIDSLNDKYKYLDRGIFNYQDKLQYESVKNQILEKDGENVEGEEEQFELDENFVEYISLNSINTELEIRQRQYEKLEGITKLFKRDIIKKMVPYIPRGIAEDSEKIISNVQQNNNLLDENKEKHYRIATTEEKRFARFFKRRIRGTFEKEYEENVSVKEHVSNLYVVLNIFYDFMIKKKISDVFNIYYVTEILQKMIETIITKDNYKDLVENEDKEIIQIVLFIVLAIYKDLDYIKYNQQGRILLNKYNEADDNIRDNYEEDLEAAIQIYNKDIKLNKPLYVSDIKNDFEQLFNYKTEKRMHEYLRKELHTKNYTIKTEPKDVTLNVRVETLNGYYTVNETIKSVFREIKKYYYEENKRVIIIFEKVKPLYDDKPKELMKVQFMSDMNNERIESIDILKDGSISNY